MNIDPLLVTSKLETFLRCMRVEPCGISTNEIAKIFLDAVEGKSISAYYLLDPQAEHPPIKTDTKIYKWHANIRPLSIFIYFVYFSLCVSFFLYQFITHISTNAGLALARGSAGLIWISLPATLMPVISNKVSFSIHYVAGFVTCLASITHMIGHMIYGKSVYRDGAAITGWILIGIIAVAWPLAYLRTTHYNFFFFTHLAFPFLFIPIAMIHVPVSPFSDDAMLWMVMLAPFALYVWFKMPKYLSPKKTWILSVQKHEDVLILTIDKKFHFMIGQYILINIPEIAQMEYHAFSLSSDPNSDSASIHIQARGDWTRRVLNEMNVITYVNYDGPYETVTMNMVKYRTAVLIAVGIGITPYISILNHCPPHTNVILIFTTRQQHLFKFIKPAPTVKIHAYYTKYKMSHNLDTLKGLNELVYGTTGKDMITGYNAKTIFSRPSWSILSTLIEHTHVGVFYCGPWSIEKEVRRHCPRVPFYSENFG